MDVSDRPLPPLPGALGVLQDCVELMTSDDCSQVTPSASRPTDASDERKPGSRGAVATRGKSPETEERRPIGPTLLEVENSPERLAVDLLVDACLEHMLEEVRLLSAIKGDLTTLEEPRAAKPASPHAEAGRCAFSRALQPQGEDGSRLKCLY